MKFAYIRKIIRIIETYRLLHINISVKITIKKDIINIQLIDRPTLGNNNN